MTAKDIADQNDKIRKTGLFGPDEPNKLLISPGVADLGTDAMGVLVMEFMHFKKFNAEDDPSGHHDFGALEVSGIVVWFKIDTVDADMDARVITFCLPSEF